MKPAVFVKPHLAALTVNIIYGLNFVIAKDVMYAYVQPFGFVLIRALTAVLFFAVLFLFRKREKIASADLGRLLLCGFFGVALNQLLFFIGLSQSTPINGAIIMATNPVMVMLIAALFIGEKLTARRTGGITVAGIGAVLLILLSLGDAQFNSDTLTGNVFILINALSFAIFMVLSKPLMRKYSPLTIISWTFFFGILFVAPVGFQEFAAVQWQQLPVSIWLKISYVAVGVTIVAYMLNTYALKYLDSSTVSSYIYVQPVIAAGIALLSGADRLTWQMAVCGTLIFSGIYLAGRKKSKFTVEVKDSTSAPVQ